ncbi:MAG: sugar ABC transporter permease [Clostridiales bacterium]|nr:sugar ABC transporter permease [Clostridiales bacterium]
MKTNTLKTNLRQYTMMLMLVIIIIFFQFLTGGRLLLPMNVNNLVNQNAYVVILAVSMLICILTGGNIDLSVGSVVCLVSAFAGQMIIVMKWNPYLSILLCLLIGALLGMWQGFWIAYIKIPAFIVTLSGMLVFRGLALLILNGLTLAPFPDAFKQFSTGSFLSGVGKIPIMGMQLNPVSLISGIVILIVYWGYTLLTRASKRRKGYQTEGVLTLLTKSVIISAVVLGFFFLLSKWRGVPSVLIIIGLLLLVYSYLTTNTVMGRHIYAIGGNEKAARLSGVKTNKLIFLAYVNMGFLAGLAGLAFAGRVDSAYPGAGQSFELDAIGACYVGGASAYGGVGTVGGALVGALIFGILNNGMSLMGINSNMQQVVKGLVLLGAVAFDVVGKMNIASGFRLGKKFKPTIVIGK